MTKHDDAGGSAGMAEWFADAKLGLFLHWGLYSVDGVQESWSFFKGDVSYADYMKQLGGFTASRYAPDTWAELARRMGARYAVLTARHHEGFALWPSAHGDLNVRRAPAGRDLVGPYCEAMRRAGVKVGLYYSHSDWSHPDYVSVRHPGVKDVTQADPHGFMHRRPDRPEDPEAWRRFLAYHHGQIEELQTRYDPDLLWFDGDWERSAEQWEMAAVIGAVRRRRPDVVFNERTSGCGGYMNPEQGMITEAPPRGPWEFCLTLNDSWGYQAGDHNHKTPRMVTRLFAEVIGLGGNLLLGIGPREDGSLLAEQVAILEVFGDWVKRHDEAIHGTGAGLPSSHFSGASTLSRDRTTLYLFQFDRPLGPVPVKGIRNAICTATVLGRKGPLRWEKNGGAPFKNIPGVLWIELPEAAVDPLATVIKLELEGPLDLYAGAGTCVDVN